MEKRRRGIKINVKALFLAWASSAL